jgi:hypothetical protein
MAFILMLSLIGISLLSVGKYSMLSSHGVIHACDRIEYYNSLRKEIKKEAYYMGIPYGIKKKCLDGVFTNEQIRSDMSNALTSQIQEKHYTIETEQIKTAITENVEEVMGELSSEQKESLDAYVDEVAKLYREKMVIPGSEYLAKMINVSTKIAVVGIPIFVLLAILCVFFLISTRKYSYHGLRYVVYGTLGAGITLLTIFAGLISNAFIYRFNISDVYMRKFYTFLIGHEMLMQAFVGIGLLIAGAIMIYMVVRQKVRLEE